MRKNDDNQEKDKIVIKATKDLKAGAKEFPTVIEDSSSSGGGDDPTKTLSHSLRKKNDLFFCLSDWC